MGLAAGMVPSEKLALKRSTLKLIALNLVLLILVTIFSLPFLYFYFATFLLAGGGWACAGRPECHFVINPLGYAMIIAPVLALCGADASWVLRRNKP